MTSILLAERIGYEQESYYSNLSFLFGNLPIQLPVNEIIKAANKSKTIKLINNLDSYYKGQIIGGKFFKLKPTKGFIDILSNIGTSTIENAPINYGSLTVEAFFEKHDTASIELEFKRIIKLFTPNFEKGKIESETTKTKFYKLATDIIPTLVIFINTLETKYIKVTYFKK